MPYNKVPNIKAELISQPALSYELFEDVKFDQLLFNFKYINIFNITSNIVKTIATAFVCFFIVFPPKAIILLDIKKDKKFIFLELVY